MKYLKKIKKGNYSKLGKINTGFLIYREALANIKGGESEATDHILIVEELDL